jgi:tRNA threonylcarbamoyladenosine modification (KEOPS) complex  Pcc1 subunit
VKCECSFSLEFDSAETARKILDSVKLDNGEWIAARLDGNRIVCEASSGTIGGLLRTAEDFLACLALAEKMMRKK